jgi:hypothetical protein
MLLRAEILRLIGERLHEKCEVQAGILMLTRNMLQDLKMTKTLDRYRQLRDLPDYIISSSPGFRLREI